MPGAWGRSHNPAHDPFYKHSLMAMQALREAPDVMERGYVDKFDNFNVGGKDTPSSYTAMLYNSSIIPCPRGILTLSTAQHCHTPSPNKKDTDD